MIKKIKNQLWYFDKNQIFDQKNIKYSILVNRLLYSKKSQYQKIEIFDNNFYGRILALDNIIQLTTRFENIYHELLIHPAILYHNNPKKILILGGGDGFAVKEILKYPVEKIILVDIDKTIIELSKKYFSQFNNYSLYSKKLTIINQDAFIFLKNNQENFDIIINDLTDPTPVAQSCWNKKFYNLLSKNINNQGIIVFQSGGLTYQYGKKVRKELKSFFKFYKIYQYSCLSYPEDIYTFFYGSNSIDFKKVDKNILIKKFKNYSIKNYYYHPIIDQNLTLNE